MRAGQQLGLYLSDFQSRFLAGIREELYRRGFSHLREPARTLQREARRGEWLQPAATEMEMHESMESPEFEPPVTFQSTFCRLFRGCLFG